MKFEGKIDIAATVQALGRQLLVHKNDKYVVQVNESSINGESRSKGDNIMIANTQAKRGRNPFFETAAEAQAVRDVLVSVCDLRVREVSSDAAERKITQTLQDNVRGHIPDAMGIDGPMPALSKSYANWKRKNLGHDKQLILIGLLYASIKGELAKPRQPRKKMSAEERRLRRNATRKSRAKKR